MCHSEGGGGGGGGDVKYLHGEKPEGVIRQRFWFS